MKIKRYDNPFEYLEKVESFLMENEIINNLMLGLLYAAKPEDDFSKNYYGTVLDEDGNLVLAMMVSGLYLIVYGKEEGFEEEVKEAVKALIAEKIQFPGIMGPKNIANGFIKQYEKESQRTMTLQKNLRIYKLTEVNDIKVSPGAIRLGVEKDLDILVEFYKGFASAIGEPLDLSIVREKTAKLIADELIYVWEDQGQVVSMAKKGRVNKHGIVLTLVYSPPEVRGKGYASSCVAALSRKLLDEYEYCALYTDLANPTSNSIYMKIGYEPVIDSVCYIFE